VQINGQSGVTSVGRVSTNTAQLLSRCSFRIGLRYTDRLSNNYLIAAMSECSFSD
jgi:hypothetical protein